MAIEVQQGSEFTTTDTDTVRDYEITRGGQAVDISGVSYADPVLRARNVLTGENVAEITGSRPSANLARFNHDTIVDAGAGEYLCEVEIVHLVNGTQSIRRPFKITVRASVHDPVV